jgi:CRP-like cAMP-binding protein
MSLSESTYPFADNRLLSRLPRADYERLRPHFQSARLPRGRVVYEAGEEARHIYFLTSGMASLMAATADDDTVQIAMVGSEGALGLLTLLGVNLMPYRVEMRTPAFALRINAAALGAEFGRGGPLHDSLLRYLHTLIAQISQTALCNRYHTVEERLCRWLLTSCDGTRSDLLALTQESLAHMVGSQRTGVTAVAASLKRRALISYRHGKIRLLDRRGLEARSCECYRVITQEIEHYLAA